MASARSVLTLLLVLASAPAFADDKAEAKKHYELGKRHFNINEFAEAIAEFKTAYKLYPQANDLYNIAQAYRLLGDCANAAQFYANYQREEKIKRLRDSVAKVRAEMEACAAAPKPTEPPPPPDPAAGKIEPPPPPPASKYQPPVLPAGPPTGEYAMRPPPGPEDPNRARRRAGVGLMVVGGVSLGASILWAIDADSKSKKVKDCEVDLLCSDFTLGELERDRDKANQAAAGTFGFGVVCGGVGYLLYRFSKKPAAAKVTITPTRHGAAVGWAF